MAVVSSTLFIALFLTLRFKVISFSLCIVSKESEPEAVVLLYRRGLIPRHRADYFCFDYESTGMSSSGPIVSIKT